MSQNIGLPWNFQSSGKYKKMKVCLGVVCIGQSYIEEFDRLFKPSLVAYTAKHGYDLKVFTEFLDSTKEPSLISFQKALVPSHESLKDYDLIVVIDADIYITANSPPIHTIPLNGKIGIVNELNQVSGDQLNVLRSRIGIPDMPVDYYKKSGFDIQTYLYLNSGLLLCSPANGELLKNVYYKYKSSAVNHPRGFHYEQSCIGYELITQNMYTLIPNEWNHIYTFSVSLGVRKPSAYCVHFAGMRGYQRESMLRTFLTIYSRFR